VLFWGETKDGGNKRPERRNYGRKKNLTCVPEDAGRGGDYAFMKKEKEKKKKLVELQEE